MASLSCSVDGCERLRRSTHGWCLMHYKRWKRTGRLQRPSAEERFWGSVRVDETTGCWLWTGTLGRGGYSQFTVGAKDWHSSGHKWAYQHFIGPVPDGLHLDHLCRTPACVNPAHLEPVTCRENLLRGDTFQAKNAAKTHCLRGHEFTPENTYRRLDRPGHRACKTCQRMRDAALKAASRVHA